MASHEEKEAAIMAFIDAASALVGEIFGSIRAEGKEMAELMARGIASGGAVSVPPSPLVALDNGEMVLTHKTVEKIRGGSPKFVDDEVFAEGGSSPPP